MAEPAWDDPHNRHARLLVVDDERANVVLLERVLQRAGYANVWSTTDSKEAMPLLEAWNPDLILLDLMMPPPDGFDILAQLRGRSASERIPVLVLTASSMPDIKERAFMLGASDFVAKPFDHSEVLLRIRNLLATRALEVSLRKVNEALESRVAERTRALTASLADLQRSMEERERLASRVVTAQEEERRRIASDIHDDTVQAMVAAGLGIERLRRSARNPGMAADYDALQERVREAIARLRNLLFDVHPATLERDGLRASLHAYLERMHEAGGPAFTLVDRTEGEPAPATRATLYRIAQEALTNVRRHAEATRVDVELRAADGAIIMRIADDGIGLPAGPQAAQEGHLGMTTMRERAELAGGALRLSSRPGAGTAIEVRLPSPQSSEARSLSRTASAPRAGSRVA